MKRSLFFLVFLICSIFSFSQLPSGFPTQFNTGWQRWGYSQSDSGSIIAVRDTSWTPRFAGTVVTWRNTGVDTSLWMYTGFKWLKLLKTGDASAAVWGTITGTLSNQTDLQNALNLKLNISDTASMLTPYLNLTGYGIVRSGQFFRADTSQLATQYDLTQIPAEGIQPTLVAGDTANRRINFKDLGDTSATHTFFTQTIVPPNYNISYAYGPQGLWNVGFSYYPGVNPGSGRPNTVFSPVSYNMNPGGSSRSLVTEAALGLFYEAHFEMGGAQPYFEMYNQIIQTDGFSYRPNFSVYRKNAREHTMTQKVTTANWLALVPTGADDTALYNMGMSGHAFGTLGNFALSLTNRRATGNSFSITLDNDGPIIQGTGISQNRLVVPSIQSTGYLRNANTYGGEVLLGQTGLTSHLRFLPANQAISTRAGIFNQTTATEVTYIGIGINSSFLFGNGVTASTGGSIFFTSNPGVPSIQFATKAPATTTDIVAGVFGQNGNFNVGGGAITTPPEEITVDVRSSAATNTIVTNEASRHTTSGTAAAGFGVQKSWILETDGSAERTVALDAVSLMSAINTQEYAQRIFYLMTNGAAASEKMRLTGLGTLHIGAYTAGANVDSRGLYVRRSVGAFPDSIETITSIGSDLVQVLDATTGKFKKITAANLSTGLTTLYAGNGTATNRTVTVSGFLNFSGANVGVTAGTSTGFAKVGGVIWNETDVNVSSGTGETDLYTYTTLANTLGTDGEWLEYNVEGVFNPGSTVAGATMTARAYWAGTEILEASSTTATAYPYVIKVRVVRTSSTNARVTAWIIGGGTSFTGVGADVNPRVTNVTTTFSNTNVIRTTGQTTDGTQDMNVQVGDLKWWPQNLPGL